MPKKAAKGKKKEKAVKAPSEPTPEELEALEKQKVIQELKLLKSEHTTELKLINGFQQSKAKLENFWTMEKQLRDDFRMELRNKFRQRQDLQEKQQFEIKVRACISLLSSRDASPATRASL